MFVSTLYNTQKPSSVSISILTENEWWCWLVSVLEKNVNRADMLNVDNIRIFGICCATKLTTQFILYYQFQTEDEVCYL